VLEQNEVEEIIGAGYAKKVVCVAIVDPKGL
jgi:hypothetical protein